MIRPSGPSFLLLIPQPGSKPEKASPNGSSQHMCNPIISIGLGAGVGVGEPVLYPNPASSTQGLQSLVQKTPNVSPVFLWGGPCGGGGGWDEAAGRGFCQTFTLWSLTRKPEEPPSFLSCPGIRQLYVAIPCSPNPHGPRPGLYLM